MFTKQKARQDKTFHTGAADKEWRYAEVWRLAPRRELMLRREPSTARVGQTLRFEYTNGSVTINVTKTLSRHIEGIVQCGQGRGERRIFEKVEMVNNQEIFAYNNLGDLFKSMEKAKWELYYRL